MRFVFGRDAYGLGFIYTDGLLAVVLGFFYVGVEVES